MDWTFISIVFLLSSVAAVTNVVSPVDYVILLDSSDHVRSTNFENEERFAVQLVRSIHSGENRIGLFTFGDNTHAQFNLNSYNDEQQIVQAIKYMWYSTGNGNVEKAINFTLANGFQESAGDRECVPNIFVVLTHSAMTDRAMAQHIGDELRRKSVQTFVLNMAGSASSTVFEAMTNSSARVIAIDDFAALENSVTGLSQQMNSEMPTTGCGRLTQWQTWTKCSVTCGRGLRYRLRECLKKVDTEKDCAGDLSEASPCSKPSCTDPVDGRWANWNSWSTCSKSCDTGVQTRTRECAAPAPLHGGKPCPGTKLQRRDCSEWKCPDCQKSCPSGAGLSQDCGTCVCVNANVFGQITDETGLPVENADIYLDSMRYKAITKTDEMGDFSISGICLMNEQIFISANRHESKLQVPTKVNSTHWTINGTIEKYVPAVFSIQPHDKSRMVGQSFSLCCSAVGKPSPTIYTWLRNDIELENMGTNGTLTIDSASKSHAGAYKCRTETLAGVSESDEAHVTVSDFAADTCGAPVPKLEVLPAGCFLTGDSTRNASIDVGTCGRAKCMTSSLKDNGTCTDWWPHYCCDTENVEELDISCDGFSYTTTRVKSCQCKLCIHRTTISGRAIGKNNSEEIPFRLGSVMVNGKEITKTNMAGFFKFDVQQGVKRVVVIFHDSIFKKFMDITKIIYVTDGEDTFANIIIPLRPKAKSFNTSHHTEIELGGEKDGLSAAASLSIQKDSFVGSDGQIYRGHAKATVHFMDPRDRDSLDAANGEFVSESPDGEKMPLRTFGMFQMGVDDANGNPLQIQKPVKFYLDSSLFNISLDSKGDPDLALWDYDVNKGIWVEHSKLQFAKATHGRRKRFASNNGLEAIWRPVNIPPLQEFDVSVHYERKITGYTNCDQSIPIWENVKVKNFTRKDNICFAGVSVYADMTLTEPHNTMNRGVVIHAYTRDMFGTAYLGKKEETRLVDGHACLMIFCDQHVYINVEADGGEKLFAAAHRLPPPYPVIHTKNDSNEVKFESRDFGPYFDGPVYQYDNRFTCTNAARNANSMHFNFAFFTKPSQMSYKVGSENTYDKKLSWYPVSPDKPTFRSCFIKVQLKIYDTYDIRILATSYLDNVRGDQFGTHTVGPTPNPDISKQDRTIRGACLEYRCPGYIKDGPKEIFNKPTTVEIQLATNNASMKCNLSVPNPGLQSVITPITSSNGRGTTGARFVSNAGQNYGSVYGVFINDAHKNDVEKFCKSGQDNGPNIDGRMDPSKNPAIVFDCLN